MQSVYFPREISWERKKEFGDDVFYLSHFHRRGYSVPNFFLIYNPSGDVYSGTLGEIYNACKKLSEYSYYEYGLVFRLIFGGQEQFVFSYSDIYSYLNEKRIIVEEVPPILVTGKIVRHNGDFVAYASFGIRLERSFDKYSLKSGVKKVAVQKTKTVFGLGGRIQKVPVDPSDTQVQKLDSALLEELRKKSTEIIRTFPEISEIRFFVSRGKIFIYYLC